MPQFQFGVDVPDVHAAGEKGGLNMIDEVGGFAYCLPFVACGHGQGCLDSLFPDFLGDPPEALGEKPGRVAHGGVVMAPVLEVTPEDSRKCALSRALWSELPEEA